MLLNEGVNPVTNGIVLPPSVVKATTTGYIITSQRAQFGPRSSLATYGLGWSLASYRGHEVSRKKVRIILVALISILCSF